LVLLKRRREAVVLFQLVGDPLVALRLLVVAQHPTLFVSIRHTTTLGRHGPIPTQGGSPQTLRPVRQLDQRFRERPALAWRDVRVVRETDNRLADVTAAPVSLIVTWSVRTNSGANVSSTRRRCR